MSQNQFPLREKRKAETRQSLIEAAQALFGSQGYENTTLEEIAERAGLHVQTLYRHFSSKQELATAGDQERLTRFREAIRKKPRSQSTFQFWRAWIEQGLARAAQDGGEQIRKALRQRWGASTVSSRLIAIGHEYEDLLTESLAQDFKMPADDISTPRMVAIMLWGAHTHVLRQHAVLEDFDFPHHALAVVDETERLFGHLIKPKPTSVPD